MCSSIVCQLCLIYNVGQILLQSLKSGLWHGATYQQHWHSPCKRNQSCSSCKTPLHLNLFDAAIYFAIVAYAWNADCRIINYLLCSWLHSNHIPQNDFGWLFDARLFYVAFTLCDNAYAMSLGMRLQLKGNWAFGWEDWHKYHTAKWRVMCMQGCFFAVLRATNLCIHGSRVNGNWRWMDLHRLTCAHTCLVA